MVGKQEGIRFRRRDQYREVGISPAIQRSLLARYSRSIPNECGATTNFPEADFPGVSWLHHNEDGVSQAWASRTNKVINTEGSAPSRAHSRKNPQTHNLG